MDSLLGLNRFVKKLLARINYEKQTRIQSNDFKLANIRELQRRLDYPDRRYPVIHVAGTKGKGSVCHFVGSILASAGQSVGIYTSPHLERINQRIQFAGQEISNDQLVKVLEKLDPFINEVDALVDDSTQPMLTFFEVITMAAIQFFADQAADVGVLEVGLGGRLDSTNICQPEVCVITNISLDHTRQLGSTTAEIAAEKAGIVKAGVPVVCGVLDAQARSVIHEVAAERSCPVFQLDRDFEVKSTKTGFVYQSNLDGFTGPISDLSPGLHGLHQHLNAAIAIATCEALMVSRPEAWSFTPQAISAGVAGAFLPGRCEIMSPPESQGPVYVLDIAHNEASSIALAQTLSSELPSFQQAQNRTLIFAVSREKDAAAMLAPLLPLFETIIITKFVENPRGREIAEVLQIASELRQQLQLDVSLETAPSPSLALARLGSQRGDEEVICVAGSAFLVAELRPLLLAKTGINR